MNVLVVHAHPEPNSFSAALAEKASAVFTSQGHVLLPFIAWSAAHVTAEVRRAYLEAFEGRLRAIDETKAILGA